MAQPVEIALMYIIFKKGGNKITAVGVEHLLSQDLTKLKELDLS